MHLLSLIFFALFPLFTFAQQQSAQYTDSDTFRASVLNVTNSYRRQHNASELSWNETLAEAAEKWSQDCKFEHSGGPYGENLASGYPNVSASVMAWGHERVEYNFRAGEFSTATGHFTQLVWKGTRQVGCARTQCDGKGSAPGWFLVCEYWPGGNVLGAFGENVQAQVGGADGEVPDERGSGGRTKGWTVGGVIAVMGMIVWENW